MINSTALLADLRRFLKTLEDDIRARIGEQEPLDVSLKSEWHAARAAERTDEAYETWLEELITQAAVHWLLACVFLRFIEDNALVQRPYLAGPGGRLALARDRHEAYFRSHPMHSDRDYLIACFREVEQLPAMAALLDERHNPVFRISISGDAAMGLLALWQKIDPDTGQLVHDFTDREWNTRFLGDLYQDLSEAARTRYALLQTPIFVEEFILDRTLAPAVNEFGYREIRIVDPTCGSGHFLLGAFQRLVDIWARNEPARNAWDTVQQALNAIYGVDLNPFAVAIARFRLLAAALRSCKITRLSESPAFKINLAAGDSLLHGRRFRELDLSSEREAASRLGLRHAYAIEDLEEVNRILGQQYHAVVGNPPYITVKDAALNQAYRARYPGCHRQYSLGVPFTERFFDLALSGNGKNPAGFVGMITTNSFMKREFGSKLIERFLPTVDLTHVIDTSGAYIPGHGTPTVILFGRDRLPVGRTVRTVMGIKGEPSTPQNSSQGLVWRAILEQLDRPGSESAFVSVADMPRTTFAKHPWSIGGGGAADLKDQLEQTAKSPMSQVVEMPIGRAVRIAEEDVFMFPPTRRRNSACPSNEFRDLVIGENVRDWAAMIDVSVWYPYGYDSTQSRMLSHIWAWRTTLRLRKTFQGVMADAGLAWFEYMQHTASAYQTPFSITFAFVATHNHFVLDRGGKVFNRSAPVIKLPSGASEDAHLGLLGLLNSSLACFWMKQTFHNKGSTVDNKGARQRTDAFEDFYEYTGTGLADFPLVADRPADFARHLDRLASELADLLPSAPINRLLPTRQSLDAAREKAARLRRQTITLQEELDWRCYHLYGLIEEPIEASDAPELALGERAFEILLARRLAAGDDTTWFERHGSRAITKIPSHWPDDYRRLVERRMALIESDRRIALIERPECKRRWNSEPWEEQEARALRSWLLDRLEDVHHWAGEPQLRSVAKLADLARLDRDFMQVAELYAGRPDFDVLALVGELVAAEAVPFLPGLRYSDSGLRKREQWERAWALQREEDAVEDKVAGALRQRDGEADEVFAARLAAEQKHRKQAEVGDIPVPPKYQSKDFLTAQVWRLRGGLDVPKERFVSYPHCERGADVSLVIAWAGWNHLQQATAIASYYLNMKDNEGWTPTRLQPLLAGLLELVPWLKQWHNEYNAEHATRMGDYFESFVVDEARALGLTPQDLKRWAPPAKATAGRGRKKKEATV